MNDKEIINKVLQGRTPAVTLNQIDAIKGFLKGAIKMARQDEIAENIRLESENKYLKADNANIREEMDKSKSENASWKKGYEQEHELAKTALEKTIVVMKENAELRKNQWTRNEYDKAMNRGYQTGLEDGKVDGRIEASAEISELKSRWEKLKKYSHDYCLKRNRCGLAYLKMQELENIGNKIDSSSPDNTKSYCKDISIPAAKLGVANDKRDKGLGPPKLSQPLPPKPEMRIYVCPICNEEFDLKDLSHGFGVCKKCKNTVHANPKPDAKYKRIPSHYRNGKKIRGYLVKIKPKPDDVHYARGRTIKKHKTFWDKKPSAKGGK